MVLNAQVANCKGHGWRFASGGMDWYHPCDGSIYTVLPKTRSETGGTCPKREVLYFETCFGERYSLAGYKCHERF